MYDFWDTEDEIGVLSVRCPNCGKSQALDVAEFLAGPVTVTCLFCELQFITRWMANSGKSVYSLRFVDTPDGVQGYADLSEEAKDKEKGHADLS